MASDAETIAAATWLHPYIGCHIGDDEEEAPAEVAKLRAAWDALHGAVWEMANGEDRTIGFGDGSVIMVTPDGGVEVVS